MPPRHRPERVCLFAQNVLHGAGQVSRAAVGGDYHNNKITIIINDGIISVL